jgi:hypothetical protein
LDRIAGKAWAGPKRASGGSQNCSRQSRERSRRLVPRLPRLLETLLAFVSYFRGEWEASAERCAALSSIGEKQRIWTQPWGYNGQAALIFWQA